MTEKLAKELRVTAAAAQCEFTEYPEIDDLVSAAIRAADELDRRAAPEASGEREETAKELDSLAAWMRENGGKETPNLFERVAQLLRTPAVTEAMVERMVQRFLRWKLPADFSPDCGITFKADFNEDTPWPMKHEPVGTNLLNAKQAEEMVRFILSGEK